MQRLLLTCLLLGIVAVWGWTFTLVKDAIATYGVVAFLAVRFSIAAVAMTPLAFRCRNRRSLLVGSGIGIVLAAAYLFQTFGLERSTPTNTGLITGLFILFVPVADRWLFGVPTRAVWWLAIGLTVAGMILLAGGAPEGMMPGDPLTIAAAVCLGLHVSLLGRFSPGHDAGTLAVGQIATAALVLGIAWPLVGTLSWPGREVWPALLVTGVVATAAGFLVQTYVQQRLSTIETGVIIMLEPLFAALFGYLLAGDRLTPVQIAGAVLMLAAVFLVELLPQIAAARARRRIREEIVDRTVV